MSEAGQPEPALSTLDVRIRPAAAADVPRLEELLTKAHLPSRLIVEFLAHA